MELQSIDIRDPSLMAATLVFGLRVDNPNHLRLNLRQLNYDLKLNRDPFVDGTLNDLGVVKPAGPSFFELPVRVNYLRLFHSIQEMLENRKLGYQLKGKLLVSGMNVPFDLGGVLELPAGLDAIPH